METGDWLKATVYGSLPNSSNPVVNTFDWRVVVTSNPTTLQADGGFIASAIIERYYTALSSAISSGYTIYQISLRVRGKPEEGYDALGPLYTGGVAGIIAPPFVCYNVAKQRDNFSMRNGRWGYAGVPVVAIAAGGIPSSTVDAIFSAWGDGIADTFMEVEGDDADMTFDDVIVREPALPDGLPIVWSGINAVVLRGFGTQNTRKA